MVDKPFLTPGTVRVSTTTGEQDAPAVRTGSIPGLAVTMTNFGLFEVTHVASGARMSAQFERAGSALLVLARLGAIGRAYGLDFGADGDALRSAFAEIGEGPVPFDGAVRNAGGETHPLTVSQWISTMRSQIRADEFPWETASEAPWNRATALLESADTA